MALQWGHSQMFFSCPDDRHAEIKSAVNAACDAAGDTSWWGNIEDAGRSRYSQEGEEWFLEYDTEDDHSDEVYRTVQDAIPDITFRYVEAGMSYD